MSLSQRHILFPGDDGSDRQAPSAIINAGKAIMPWQFLLGTGWLAVAAATWWSAYLKLQYKAVVVKLEGVDMDTGSAAMAFAGLPALVPLLFAVASLRCGAALKKFVRSGLLADLHPAMKRLRGVWRIMALVILLSVVAFITLIGFVLWRRQQ